jgi:hypothetical protein
MSEKYSEDNSTFVMLGVTTVIGIVFGILFPERRDDLGEVTTSFVFIYLMFVFMVIDWIIYRIKKAFFKKHEA